MADLDTLRPEVRDAINRQDRQEKCDEYCPVCEDRATIRAELLRLATVEADALIALDCEHDWQVEHKRAEKAEAELLRLANKNRVLELKNRGTLANNLCPDHRDKQVGRPCLACLIEKAEAELVDLKVKYTRLNEVCENAVRCLREQDDEADRNEAELAALKDKIADAPITQVTRMAAIGGGGYEWAGCRVPDAWNGKRVRLLLVTATEDGPTGSQPASRTPDPAPQG